MVSHALLWQMGASGVLWGTLFLVFLLFAGIATVIAVFESIVAVCQDCFKWSRAKASTINCLYHRIPNFYRSSRLLIPNSYFLVGGKENAL